MWAPTKPRVNVINITGQEVNQTETDITHMLCIHTSMHNDKVIRTVVIDYNCSITSSLCIQHLYRQV